jgi:hypothetical protein
VTPNRTELQVLIGRVVEDGPETGTRDHEIIEEAEREARKPAEMTTGAMIGRESKAGLHPAVAAQIEGGLFERRSKADEAR